MLFCLNSEQQPMRLNPVEVCEVIAAVCSEMSSPNVNIMTLSSRLHTHGGKPSMDVAVSVLVKLIIDMYVFMLLAGIVSPYSSATHLTLFFYDFLFENNP